jgi:LPPG:FO 2-phospho-L-lactate transferase
VVNGGEVRVTALAGGVGGAKLADGLAQIEEIARGLTVIVNTGDDFSHYGLRICPDLDTVCYTLAGLANEKTGWGRKNETWQAFEGLRIVGGETWFQLGDQDLATHLERTRRLGAGDRLSQVTADFCRAWNVPGLVLPMSDDPVATWVETVELGWLPFQEYFVKHACRPKVQGFKFEGAQFAQPAPGVLAAIQEADLIVVCPSNPFVSIAPILSIKGILAELINKPAVIAVSPIVGGNAIKGPAAKMFTEFGRQPSSFAVAQEYKDWIQGFLIDPMDADLKDPISSLGIDVWVEDAIMHDRLDRRRLAHSVVGFGRSLLAKRRHS